MLYDIMIVSLVGALLSLDRTAAFQSMIAQPIITAPIIGYILGDITVGIMIGAALELLWLCVLPLGAFIPPDENIATTLVTSCTILGMTKLHIHDVHSFIVLNILLLIPTAYVGRIIDNWVRNLNIALSNIADKEVEMSDFDKVESKNLVGLVTFYLVSFALIFIILSFAVKIIPFVYEIIPGFIIRGLNPIYPLILIIGVAIMLWGNKVKNSLIIFSVSYLIFSLILKVL